MSNYSGETSFEFMIERYRDIESGKYYTDDNVPSVNDFEFKEETITLKVEGRSFFEAGCYTGPWEDSYPDADDTEIMSVIGPDKKDWESQLTKEETESIIEIIQSNVMEECQDSRYDD